MFLLKWSDIQGSLDYSIRAQSQKDIRWISPANNHRVIEPDYDWNSWICKTGRHDIAEILKVA
jgi:hypothetical protein